MKGRRTRNLAKVFVFLLIAVPTAAKEKKPKQTGWAEVTNSVAEVRSKPSAGKKALTRLSAGALVATYQSKRSDAAEWTQVRTAIPATLEPVTGWVESSRLRIFPSDRFPSDEDLEKAMGGVYLEDVTTKYIQIARFLVERHGKEPLVAAYIGSTFLPHTRLQVFEMKGGTWTAGPYVEFLSSEVKKTGMTEIEVRDLLGDGNECFVTHEPFAQSFASSGVNLVIRRVEGGGFETLWQAPLEVSNLSSFPPKIKVLDPPEKNIGAPGTVSTGTVEYRRNGRIDEPIWKGKVEFHIPGREKPVDTLNIEKVCPWNGSEFAPLN